MKAGVSDRHEEGTPALDTYRHAIEWKLSVDFKLIRCRQPPAGVQQDIIELEGQAEVYEPNGSLLPLRSSQGSRQVPDTGSSSPTVTWFWTVKDKQLGPLTRKNIRCWSPFPESLLRLPRRMNSCGADGDRASVY